MMAKIDRFLVAELQEGGYDLDYKELVEIYRASRNRPDCMTQKIKNQRENEMINKMAEKLTELGLD